MNKYIRFPNFKLKAVTLSYDDGVRQDKRLIAIMKKYGLKGTFNLNGGWFDDGYTGLEKRHMTREEALDLYIPSGMEVAVHGYKHISLSEVEPAMAVCDVISDRIELENLFGRVIKGMAYANGAYNDLAIELLKQTGISYSRTVTSTEAFELPSDWLRLPATCHHNSPRLMELAKQFVENEGSQYYWGKKLQLFYLWGHSYEFDNDNNWEVIEKFAEYIGNREDIWYATNGEIFDYLQACQQLQFSADGCIVRNMSCLDIYIDYIDKKCIVPAGQTIKIGDWNAGDWKKDNN